MRRPLGESGHGDVPYDRPNLPWVCGLEGDGCPCAEGPTAGGRCPHRRCRPERSLRIRRGRIAVGATLFAVGLVTLLVGSRWRGAVLAPGPLTHAHARLLSSPTRHSPEHCAACHPGGVDHALGLGNAAANATQSQLCMNCHQSLIDPAHALSAHSLPPGSLPTPASRPTLASRKAQLIAASLTAVSLDASPAGDDAVACSACHQEHHGAGHDLTMTTDGRCQSCHQQQYNDFAHDHPEFGNWPYRRRTRINFDHNSHAGKHFKEKGVAFACATCHIDGPDRDAKLLVGYDQACGSCHDEGIKAGAPAGLAIFSLPMLDRDAIAAAGEDLGAWPQAAEGDFDGELSAVAKLLLATDPDAVAVTDRLGADFSLLDLDPGSAADARLAKGLADALRRLLNGLAVNGHEEVVERAAMLTGGDQATVELAGGLPVTAVDAALRRWFGGDNAPRSPATTAQLAARQSGGGWFVDDQQMAIRYVPRGHADPMLRAWIDLAAGLGPEHQELQRVALAELASSTSPGRCVVCHSLEDDPGGDGLLVHWRGLDPKTQPRPLTKFSHRPHTTQPELADCTHCHRLDPSAAPQPAPYPSASATDFVTQFEPIRKADCATCHQPKAAGHRCTQCHNYHVGQLPGDFGGATH